ncbi:MAG: GTP cyclohydrolase I FolE [Clostridia bacterium]|nr:GTP cyclohydrolase I FolE [Clostridia bacterium]
MVDKEKIQQLTQEFLLAIGEDPERDGLKDTPRRVANMCDELLNSEYNKLDYTSFDSNNYDGIVLIKDISFTSICEHHLMPFIGKINIAYIPSDEVLGISKFARIVDKHAKNLQLQERLAKEILLDIQESISPKGIAIYIEAKHLCMNIRGAKRKDSSTITALFLGEFDDIKMQNVFLNLIK